MVLHRHFLSALFVCLGLFSIPVSAQQQDDIIQKQARDLAISAYITATDTLTFLQSRVPLVKDEALSPACQQGVNTLLQRFALPRGVQVRMLAEKPLNPANKLPDTEVAWVKRMASQSFAKGGNGDWVNISTPAEGGYAHVVPIHMGNTCMNCHGMVQHVTKHKALLGQLMGSTFTPAGSLSGEIAGYMVINVPYAAATQHSRVDDNLLIPVSSEMYNIYLNATREAMLAPPAQIAEAWARVYKQLPTASDPLKETLFIRQALALALMGDERSATATMQKAARIGSQPGHWYTMPRLENAQPQLSIETCKVCHSAGELKTMTPVKLFAQGR